MKKILLFTGAGMSVPMGLPTTKDFAKTIKKCNVDLLNLLSGYYNNNANDIEQILYAIEELVNGSKFLKYIITSLTPSNGHIAASNEIIAKYISSALDFQQVIKSDLYKILQNYNRSNALNIYIKLLRSFQSTYDEFSLSIFTANYDLIFEDILSENSEEFQKIGYENCYFGFTSKWNRLLFDNTEDFKWSKTIIEYTKLHGSLDWTRDSNGSVVKAGAITLPAVPDDMPLLYPGYKGTPTDEPFLSLHNKLFLRLSECDVVYVIGFAFRDPYINSMFEFALRGNHKLTVHCYNPSSIEELPEDSAIPKFINNMPKQFLYIQKGIDDKENPIDLILNSQASST